jgi:hypothetical protein
MAAKLVESSIEDLSRRVVRHAKLPHGTEIRFFDKRNDRRKRSDWHIKRKHVVASNLHVPADDETVSSYLGCVEALITSDLRARGIVMKLYAPDGSLFNGNTHIGSVRAETPIPSDGDGDDSVSLFSDLVCNAGLGETLSLGEVGALYREMAQMLPGFEGKLVKHAALIQGKTATLNASRS